MSCPICAAPEGAALSSGIRAGAAVLIVAAMVVVLAIARFARRLWVLQERGA
jgi:hypothetical protein